MGTHMMVSTSRVRTGVEEVFDVIAEEQALATTLHADGRIGSIHASVERGTDFIEAFADDADDAGATVMMLPMTTQWDLSVCPVTAPVAAGAGS
jgi:hypothetical protein